MLVYNPKTRLTPTELRQIEDARLRRQRIAAKAVPEKLPVEVLPTVKPLVFAEEPESWEARQKRIWFRIVDEIEAKADEPPPVDYFPRVKIIQKICADHAGLTMVELLADRRQSKLVMARHIGMFFTQKYTPYSLQKIGRLFGNKDHTTVLHGARKVEDRIKADPGFAAEIETLRLRIEGAMQ